MGGSAPDPVFVLRGAESPVTAVTFLSAPHGEVDKYIAVGTQDGQILIWDLKTKCKVKEWSVDCKSSIHWLYSDSPGVLWSQNRNDGVYVWDISSSAPVVLAKYPMIDYLGFSQSHIIQLNNHTRLLALPGPSEAGVTVWDIDKKIKVSTLIPPDPKKYGNLMQPKWLRSEEATSLAVLYESGHLSLWDWANSKIVSECCIAENPMCFTYDEHTQFGVIGTASEKVFAFSINSGLSVNVVREFCIMNAGLSSCAMRPDRKIFVTGGWDSRIRVFSSKKCKPLAVLHYHKKTVECVAYSAGKVEQLGGGFLLAAGSSDKSVSLWDIYN